MSKIGKILDDEITLVIDRTLLSLYLNGVHIGEEFVSDLSKKGYINAFNSKKNTLPFESNHRLFRSDDLYKNLSESEYYSKEIVELDDIILTGASKYNFGDNAKITRSMWTPELLQTDYDPEFYTWINAINTGFQRYRHYSKHIAYVSQAQGWIAQNQYFDSSASEDVQIAYLVREVKRMKMNSLYALNKYAPVKKEGGFGKYKSWAAQTVMLYLLDLGLSYMMGKARQIGATTTLGGATGIKCAFSKDMYCKFVAQRGDKSVEMFRDKIKYPIQGMPYDIVPSMSSDASAKMEFSVKLEKGRLTGSNSLFEIAAPSDDCINGGSPAITLLDEIGYMKNFSKILSEGRTTLYGYDEKTGMQRFMRQVIAWSTGGETDGDGQAMEMEYRACMEAWMDKDFTFQMVPLFLNVFSRKGYTIDLYNKEKAVAYRKKKEAGKRDPRTYFHQGAPITWEDMFTMSSETIIPAEDIRSEIKRIDNLTSKGLMKCRYGFMQPVYDKNYPTNDESDVPYKIIDAVFIETKEEDGDTAVCIIHDFEAGWSDRYYAGTDPIFTATGTSKMSTAVWDKYLGDVAGYVNHRIEDYRYTYLQCFLLKIYYSNRVRGFKIDMIKDLIEFNVGGEYINYNKNKGYMASLTRNAKLPDILQIGSVEEVGINKKAQNAKYIVQRVENIALTKLGKLSDRLFYVQLSTFVRKATATTVRWEPNNTDYNQDDHIDAVNYAKINADECYANRIPQRIAEAEKLKKNRRRLVYNPATGQNELR
jgi:hypothetical protein